MEQLKSISELEFQSQFINHRLTDVTRLAKAEKDPWSAVKKAAAIALFMAGMAGGLVAADEIWDKYHRGELFEQHNPEASSSEHPNSVQEDPKNETRDKSTDRDAQPPRTWGGVDV